ncbi:adenosylmethionine--8-amino-7-oxononanoate transaminase [Synechococcus elongatus]|uniref:Adenosylmethionine-8-amino-7-oxononanoate aminotransferase n=2 Tax=Synechococcus elongatus TaxID=32046 RepID=BIOA_SYNE7|nr:adenosylmethionine--8-amino-7-oxononanoate transaminase [Synechococcus elongatus]Q31SA6.1 RecName: Full=Adenosylmethionine-8-amino-7-oxononanoate aminotransferase; AltName: Full=7,8-diamino-pelargonic acid aminotransferase; Short=DAPA AT; Short=DAPA aminotransferase; AltName: Full=7,8-diaminononanoate synthase; Short=DANS; AltName: Full=Diaminopelargonic acid synthase [Synechococcus elongatus PCC 7942 = FACHB-805]ABB56063.1 aminotransferase [Synechococcus elongatus PCC 7942 = FACHB-805]AJD568
MPSHPHLWFPFTSVKDAPDPLKVVSGKGARLTLADGRELIDCISSWWVNLHGHAHLRIVEAIAQQAATLEHVIFAGFSHEPAERLAMELCKILPEKLTRVFFSDNGSTAVEVALKMALQYWHNLDQPRSRILAFDGAYHGDTFGAMSVGERSLFNAPFEKLLFSVEFLPYPETWWGDETVEAKEAAAIAAVEQALAAGDVAAVIIEPLVQGAGGMRMARPQFLQQLAARVQAAGSLLIADEVMTGFGRTGAWFACQRAGIQPDLICLSKGLTGGFLPLSITVATEVIYDTFCSGNPDHTFYHGHSYTANPLGCAAAIASLELLLDSEAIVQGLEDAHLPGLELLAQHPKVTRPRLTGGIAACDLVSDRGGYLDPIGLRVRQAAIARGLLLRPLGNVLYLLPPYCLTPTELQDIYAAIADLLDEI